MITETQCASASREAKLLVPEDSVYRREYWRLHRRRHSDAGERVRRDRAAVFRAALAAREQRSVGVTGRVPGDPARLAHVFPWTDRFDESDHPLGDLGVSFVSPPPEVRRAAAEHRVNIRDVLDSSRAALLCFPGSWGLQKGIRDEPFRGDVVDYLAYAPTYLASMAQYGRAFGAAVGLSCDVIVPVFPTVCQHERKLSEFALPDHSGFVHPAAERSGRLLADALYDLALADRLPERVLFFGFSYGGALAVQCLSLLTERFAQRAEGAEALRRLRSVATLVLVASNVDYPAELPLPLVGFRSPLDSVVLGNDELALRTACSQDFAELRLPVSVRASLMRGDFEAVRGKAYEVALGPGRTQWNCPLPGAVGVDGLGAPLHHFDDLRDGHDVRLYQPVFARADVRQSLLGRPRSGRPAASRALQERC